jgi:hypothetical protein
MSNLRSYVAGCITTVLAVTLTQAVASWRNATFDEITVGRINIVEPDGTKRVIISNRAQFPGDFYKGKETQRPDRSDVAGLLFINDEGTENGGLVQNGTAAKDGKVDAGLSLTFDRFRQDQSLELQHVENDKELRSYVKINDAPDPRLSSYPEMHRYSEEMAKMTPEQRTAYIGKLKDEGKLLQNRIYLGTTNDHAAVLVLNDGKGRPRLRLKVSETGEAVVEALDESGKVNPRAFPNR